MCVEGDSGFQSVGSVCVRRVAEQIELRLAARCKAE